ncbi:hypothetical protein, partial [Nostoc sp. DedVER01b]|uniref:hypothetical protein n=1 Tax=Nostoc sp. DedVER01b TaxID=3075404 RepID=UPI002AD4A2BB
AISADLFQFFSLFYRQMDFISATSSHFRVLTLAYLLHYFSCVSPLQYAVPLRSMWFNSKNL